jgi:hypothetical protein
LKTKFIIIKQKSNYYDLSRWVQDKIKKAGYKVYFVHINKNIDKIMEDNIESLDKNNVVKLDQKTK